MPGEGNCLIEHLVDKASFSWPFWKEGLEILVFVGFLTIFAEISTETNFKTEKVVGGRVSIKVRNWALKPSSNMATVLSSN